VRDDRHYRRKNKREEHIRSIDQSVFLEKKKIGSRVQSSCYLEPAHPGIPLEKKKISSRVQGS
jgi:hypothetical protein